MTGGEPFGEEELDETAAPGDADDTAEPGGAVEDAAAEAVGGEAPPEAERELMLGNVLTDELVRVAAERDEYLDALRRLQAEFENFRKRNERLQAEAAERGAELVINRMLPALDALDLALAHVGEREGEVSELESAFVQIASLLRDVLAKEGLERIDATGVAFDPTVHDAVAHETAEAAGEAEPGADAPGGPAVVETLRAGYRLRGRVLRPAMVKVRA